MMILERKILLVSRCWAKLYLSFPGYRFAIKFETDYVFINSYL